MSRHETLLSIYGGVSAASSAKDKNQKRHPHAHPLFRPGPPNQTPRHTQTPQSIQPLSTALLSAATGSAGTNATTRPANQIPTMMRTVAETVVATKLVVVPPEPDQQQQRVPVVQGAQKKRETALEKVVRQLTQSPSSAEPVVMAEEEAPVPKLTRPSHDKRPTATPRTKARAAAARSPHKDSGGDATVSASGSGSKCASSSKVELVLSLYGDGFIETPPSRQDRETTALRKGFSLKIRLFKAAGIEKDTSHCYTEESRHTNPELDDSGEFVRWTCCGSTDSSVYGCSAAKAIQNRASTALRDKDMPAPKLIAAKLPNPNQSNGISFSIYDRGTSSANSVGTRGGGEGAQYSLDSGCHVWFKGYECWANQYALPSNRWVLLYVTFDCRYLRLYVDDNLVDSASIIATVPRNAVSNKSSTNARGNPGGGGQTMWAAAASSNVNSIYIGGHPSYSRSIRDWRLRIGFIGLIASVTMWKVSDALSSSSRALKETDNVSSAESNVDLVKTSATSSKRSGDHAMILKILFTDVGRVKDFSSYNHTVNAHRNVFWRKHFPPISERSLGRRSSHSLDANSPQSSVSLSRIDLLDNFFHGSHNDKAVTTSKSFENLLLSVIQTGDVRVLVKYALNFDMQIGSAHGCRTKKEYEQKSLAVIRELEALSPLLAVLVNEEDGKPISPCIGSFEIIMTITRDAGRGPIAIPLHSMVSTSLFPSPDEIKKKIQSIILHEAKRSPREEIHVQAFRYFLALAGRSRQNRERLFLEAVITRKVVLTERKVVSTFQKIGFHFANSELPGVVRHFKFIQDDYMKKQSCMEDLPTLSMLAPTANGMYALPLLESLSICTTLDCKGSVVKSPWRFIGIFLDHDFQLLEFIHEECPVSQDGTASLHQTRYLYGGFVHRVNLHLSHVPNRVYCILLCLQKIGHEENAVSDAESSIKELRARIQIENGETLQALGIVDMFPESNCRWFALAALYRSKKLHHWKVQALGGSSQANSIHTGLDEMHELLVNHAIIQIYEIVVSFQNFGGDEGSEFEEYAKRFSKNIRFGRNGRISLNPMTSSGNDKGMNSRRGSFGLLSPLVISLKLQGLSDEVEVYRHENSSRSLPTTQSVYRNILRILGEHGIKESLQQNPFVAQEKKSKRQVEIRVVNEQSSAPVEKAHVFIEKNLDNIKLTANLAKKIVPTLTMGSRLVSIRRRLQMKRVLDDTKAVAAVFVEEVISIGMKVALFSLRRDSKLIPYIRSRAMLKRVMRERYEASKQRILEQVKESERSRIYSRNGPIRLQQVYQLPLEFSSSERNLLEDFSEFGLEVFKEDGLFLANGSLDRAEDTRSVYEIWRAQRNGEEQDDGNPSTSTPAESDDGDAKDECSRPAQKGAKGRPDPNDALQVSLERARERKFCYVSDSEGKISCRLTPGSYSLYIFHLEYFEWTSLVVVFPSATNSGSQGGTGTSCSTAQEILVPLEAYWWTYKIQLVDFYHQHNLKRIADIPIQVVDKCSSQRYIVKTDARGCTTWEVGKGLYSVSALKECTCILYSASKNVVVDGGRYRPAKTIFVPVLIGKLTIEFALASAVSMESMTECPALTKVRFRKEEQEVANQDEDRSESAFGDPQADVTGRVDHTLAIGSSSKIPLRLGGYDVEINFGSFFTTHLSLQIGWDTSKSNARHLAVMCPVIKQSDVYRIVFSYVNAAKSMDAMIEIFKDEVPVGHVWRQHPDAYEAQVKLEHIGQVGDCEFHTFMLTCVKGFSYHCKVALSLHPSCVATLHRPRVQIFTSDGLVYESFQTSEEQWRSSFYWNVCKWDAHGELVVPPLQLQQ